MDRWTEEEIKAVYGYYFDNVKFMSLDFISDEGKKKMMSTLPAVCIVLRLRIVSAINSAIDTLKGWLGKAS